MIKARHPAAALLLAIAAAHITADSSSAQSASAPAHNDQLEMLEIPQPDLGGIDPSVQEQIRAAEAAVIPGTAQASVSHMQRAQAFGRLGQIYQAYGFDDAALACYGNASRLDPLSFRWFYYQAYLRQKDGDAGGAERDYQRTLAVDPANTPALLRLGTLELTLGRPDLAKSYFAKAMARSGPSAAGLAGLGKAALLEHGYGLAVNYFNQALAREPDASSLHYQLAMAYRGLGDMAHTQEQLQMRGDVDPAIQDPLLSEVNALKQGMFSLLQQGSAAMNDHRFAEAAAIYRQMVSLAPSDPIAYRYLGMALAGAGQSNEALKEYERSLQLDPRNPAVHYNIGVLLVQERKEGQAIVHFQQVLELDPGLVAAHFQLANLYMRDGKDPEAEREYGAVVGLDPQNSFARLMQAMAAVHAGLYARAKTLLDQAAQTLPGDADIADAQARVLAAAPDPAVRDPERALRIVEALVNDRRGDPLEVGVTFAMALAAAGKFQEAARYQQAIVAQLEASGQTDLARLLRQNLARYQQGKTCRVPWASDDPIFTPVPGTAQLPLGPNAAASGP
jgi:tetratricopeptide (TPR) repeat protein